jgi:hypothetical protein
MVAGKLLREETKKGQVLLIFSAARWVGCARSVLLIFSKAGRALLISPAASLRLWIPTTLLLPDEFFYYLPYLSD